MTVPAIIGETVPAVIIFQASLRHDKTVANPAIEEKLKELGRTAIPVNVLLVPGREPVVTPELLTPAYLKELFGKIP